MKPHPKIENLYYKTWCKWFLIWDPKQLNLTAAQLQKALNPATLYMLSYQIQQNLTPV